MTAINSIAYNRLAENELSRRRSRCAAEERERQAFIAKNCPDITELIREKRDIGLDVAQKMIESPSSQEELASLGMQLAAGKDAEIRRALTAHGLSADYLDPVYVCPICRDTGRSGGVLCSCLKQVLVEGMFSGSGLSPFQTFENYRHDLIDEPRAKKAAERIFEYCRSWAEDFPNNELPGLLLIGAPGVGKTYLLNAIGTAVLAKGHSVLRVTANKLVSSVMDSIRDPSAPVPDFSLPELLIIDDLGSEPMIGNVTIESLLSIISERQDSRRQLLIATNKDPETLANEYGERILSRLISPQSVKVIKVATPSIRVMKL